MIHIFHIDEIDVTKYAVFIEEIKSLNRYEKYKNPEGEYSYVFVGYASVYNFYCFPEHIRPRIGQMLLLPPFQKQGLAIELLSCIYRTYRSDNKVTEITGLSLALF